jgi:hypothetical protein
MIKKLKALPPLLLVTGCAAGTAVAPPAAPVEPTRPTTYSTAGLETVVGRTASYLQTHFGRPDLDVREGTGRKLQFVSPICVLDAYLYPARGGGEPIVTYLDARRPDGTDFDRASCVAALNAEKQKR